MRGLSCTSDRAAAVALLCGRHVAGPVFSDGAAVAGAPRPRPSGGRVEALGGFATYPVTVHIKAVGVGRQGWEVDQGQDLRAI